MSALRSKIGKNYIYGSALLSALIVLIIVIVLLVSSKEVLQLEWSNLFSTKWNAAKGQYGILPMIYGTLMVTFISLVFAVPIGVFTAIFVSERLPKKWRLIVKSLLELLAGIPSIIFGLIGVAYFSTAIEHLFDLSTGRTIFTAGIILAIMILPTIITLVDDALQNIPNKYREASFGLGLYKFEVIKSLLLPIARFEIKGAVLLALGRSLGETMAVMLVIGSLDKIPSPIYNMLSSGQTITSKLGREVAESAFGSTHFSVLIFMSFLLMLFVLVLTFLGQFQYKNKERLYE
ncbi:MAG: phosphate transport system permease protein [Crocinitomix sp.]|jgi:phosphate transport system permease protein